MPSPFPGMDPYLEDPDEWPDVHGRLITYIADQLQPLVHPSYRTRINRREYVMRDERSIYPDVAITDRHLRESALEFTATVPAAVSAAMANPPAVPPFHEPHSPRPRSVDVSYRVTVPLIGHREPFLEIVDRESHEIVTAIELLSPTNKRKGEGHRQYRRKQREVLASEANLVEIDLLGTGAHTVAVPADRLSALSPHRYRICVSRAADRQVFEVYAMALSDRLPRVSIPLRDPDPDVLLDLPAVFAQCYDNGGYAFDIDYSKAPPVPLGEEEVRWAREWLAGKVGVAAEDAQA